MSIPAIQPAPAFVLGGARAWYTVVVFLLLYIFSTIDRGIIGLMVGPLERDLGVSDFQLSLLMGPAFGIFYVLCGVPLGWMVDRFSRRWLTMIGVTVWGLATCFCGIAATVTQLFMARMGVGLGESVLTPAAHSLIAEQFPPHLLSKALAVFTIGSVIGSGIASAAGGAVVHLVASSPPVMLPLIGEVRAWQLAFLAVGLPTLILAPLALTVSETRKAVVRVAGKRVTDGGAALFFREQWRISVLLPVGFAVSSIVVIGMFSWTPTYMIRVFHWNAAEVGVTFGAITLVAGLVGQLGGGAVVDWLYARGYKDAHVRYHMIGLLVTIPLIVAALFSGNAAFFLFANAVFLCLTYPFVGYAAAALQMYAPNSVRGRASAILIATVGIIGTGLGPTSIALINDKILGDPLQIGHSIAIVAMIAGPIAFLILFQVARAMRTAPLPVR